MDLASESLFEECAVRVSGFMTTFHSSVCEGSKVIEVASFGGTDKVITFKERFPVECRSIPMSLCGLFH